MKKLTTLFTTILFFTFANAQNSPVVRQYIETFKEIAILEMHRTGVPAAITLAQGIHETGAGQSDLVKRSNNHFGIKCKSEWQGEKVYHDDDSRGECFRKYEDGRQSYVDHSDFLRNRSHYSALFKLDPTDYEGWAYGLKKAGYATNPKYPQILIKIIRDYDLQDYTLLALESKNKNTDVVLVSNTQTEDAASTSYPSGVFEINGSRALIVPKGTSFLKIAEQYDLSLNRLFDFNEMNPVDIAAKDELIFIERKKKKGSIPTHIVAEGETLRSIAQKNGVQLEALRDYNFLNEGIEPLTGETIYLQSEAPQTPRTILDNAVSAKATASFEVYKVKAGETLYSLSKKFEVSVEDIKLWNGLQKNSLSIGQEIKILKK